MVFAADKRSWGRKERVVGGRGRSQFPPANVVATLCYPGCCVSADELDTGSALRTPPPALGGAALPSFLRPPFFLKSNLQEQGLNICF